MIFKSVGSICSGIEAASVAWEPLGMKFEWFSEIADFPSLVLAEKYPNIQNLGDMNNIPEKIKSGEIAIPDLICGGTPCQAFSLAGWKNGLNDDRGNLTLRFVDIVNANDKEREREKILPLYFGKMWKVYLPIKQMLLDVWYLLWQVLMM